MKHFKMNLFLLALAATLISQNQASATHVGKWVTYRLPYIPNDRDADTLGRVVEVLHPENGTKSLRVQLNNGTEVVAPIEEFGFHQTALIIIDMQDFYLGCLGPKKKAALISRAISKIKKARERGHHLVFVEYGTKPTHAEILEAAEGYDKYWKVTKYQDDGSDRIIELLKSVGVPVSHFNIIGVNTSLCVRETVEGLHVHLPKAQRISVLSDACADQLDYLGVYNQEPEKVHQNALRMMSSLAPQVVVKNRSQLLGAALDARR